MSKTKALSLLALTMGTLALLLSARHSLIAGEKHPKFEQIEPVDACELVAVEEKSQEVDLVTLSEAFGHLIGSNLSAPGCEFDFEAIIRGMKLGAAGEPSPMSEEEYSHAVAMVQEKAYNELSDNNLEEANTFLAQNSHESGVVELESGKLQYRIAHEGRGELVTEGATPLIHYTGRFLDGNTFGSSLDSEPIALPLDQTITGFSQGIVGMKEGEKREIFVHPDLGYGTVGQLPPNSLLVFEVEVLQTDTTLPEANEMALMTEE